MPSPHALYSVAEIRAIEQAALAALPAFTLMQRAGQAAAARALHILGAGTPDRRVLVLAGPGNNGGDALEASACLAAAGIHVTVMLYADPDRQSADARRAYEHARAAMVHIAGPDDFGRLL
ncbi:MAG TPA: NAD(P)H-hydrate epimerase, partial [Noviherbaspirillum sp.]|nr:NAD(P)H-hydrate epimerase [Noviherbaspirillum sp.]